MKIFTYLSSRLLTLIAFDKNELLIDEFLIVSLST